MAASIRAAMARRRGCPLVPDGFLWHEELQNKSRTRGVSVTEKTFVVVCAHVSEYPEPINLKKGDSVSVGEEYEGPEGWDRWYFCSAPGQKDGWVPEQIIDRKEAGSSVIAEDYTARELDTVVGDRLTGSRVLNGWLWAKRASDGATGWVPMNTIRACGSDRA